MPSVAKQLVPQKKESKKKKKDKKKHKKEKKRKKQTASSPSHSQRPPPPPTKKRSREERDRDDDDGGESILYADVARHIHGNLIRFGLIAPLDLLHWHLQCRALYMQWSSTEYLFPLLEDAESEYANVFRRTCHAVDHVNLIHLSTMPPALRLYTHIVECRIPIDRMLDANCFSQRFQIDDFNVGCALAVAYDCKQADTRDLPIDADDAIVLRKMARLLLLRKGWALELRGTRDYAPIKWFSYHIRRNMVFSFCLPPDESSSDDDD